MFPNMQMLNIKHFRWSICEERHLIFFLNLNKKDKLKKTCKNHSCAKLLIPETANEILVLVSSAAFYSGPKYQWIEMHQKTR